MVTVTANAALTGLTTAVTGADLKLDPSSTCAATLAAGATCNVVINFTATAVGSSATDAVVVTQDGVSKSVPVTATVVTAAKLGATPTVAALVAAPGATSSPATINVGNTGGSSTGAITVVLSGANAADFKVASDTCSIVTLDAGATCAVTVTYSPAAAVVAGETATLTITDKGAGASVATITLNGTPTLPSSLAITGTSTLGSVAPGAAGAEVIFTVTNSSTTPSGALTASVNDANITISSNTCATKATLNKGDTCTVGLKLTPPATATAASVAAALTVTGSGGTASISVTGSIVSGPALSSNVPSVSFGSVQVNQSSAVSTITITNTGATATATLSAALAGTGAAQVALSGNTCTSSLAPGKTCSVAVQFNPTDTTGVTGTITVTDGAVSVAIPMVGTGLTPSQLTVALASAANTAISSYDFANVTKGYASAASLGKLVVVASSNVTTDTGAISAVISGANAADFVVSTTSCTVPLQPSATCPIQVTFTPGDVGARAAVLTVTGSKGGVWTVQLTGAGLSLVQLIPLAADSTATPVVTGLDFGMQTNGTPKASLLLNYRVVVRGATIPAATSTVASVVLTTGTTPDFRYVSSTGVASTNNPCNGGTLAFPISTSTAPAGWSKAASTAKDPGSTAATGDGQATAGYWTCDFYVEFYPQTGKSATPKTATVTATASAGGTASLALTGTASGPLTISPTPATFATAVPVGAAATANITFTIINQGIAASAQGPLSVTLAGTNGADFGIVSDACTAATLTVPGSGPPSPSCKVVVQFAPASVGAKTATLTVAGAGTSGDTVVATINGTASASASITVAPTGTLSSRVDLGSAPQAGAGAWKTFTIANPAGAAVSAKLSYTVSADFELYTLATAGVSAYPAGSCGDSNTKQLNGGDSCTIQVRVKPLNTVLPGVRNGTLTVSDGTVALPTVPLKGTATPQLTVSVAALDFGSVAPGATANQSTTITNNGLTVLTLAVPSNADAVGTNPPPVSIRAGSNCNGVALAAGGTCHLDYQFTGQTAGATVGVPTPLAITVGSNIGSTVTAGLTMQARTVNAANLALYGFDDLGASGPVQGDTVEFGNVQTAAAGASSGSGVFTFWIVNTGDVNATTVAATITGTNNTEFTFPAEAGDSCNSVANGILAPQAKCAVRVQLTPQTAGANKAATLNVSASGLTPVTVALHGSAHVAATAGVYLTPVGGAATSTIAAIASTPVGTAVKALFTVHNTGAAISLSSFTIAGNVSTDATPVVVDFSDGVGTTAADLVVVGDSTGGGTACPSAASGIVTGASCQIAVTFKPKYYGSTATDVTDGRKYRWATVNYSGTPVATIIGEVKKPALLQLTAASAGGVTVTTTSSSWVADFGQVLQQNSASLAFTITNIGESLTAGAVTPTLVAGSDPYTTVTSTCGTTQLDAGGTCTATVTVTGTNPGLHNDSTLQATGIVAGESSAQTFTLIERLVQPALLSIIPGPTDFGAAIAVGQASSALTITVRNGNSGDSRSNRLDTTALTLNMANNTDFTVLPTSTCLNTSTGAFWSLPLANLSETCTILVQFTPQSAGAKSVPVSVTAATGGTTAAVTLTGTAVGALSISPAGTSAVPVALGTGVFTVTYTGPSTSSTGLLDENTNSALFVITTDTCYGKQLTGTAPAASATCSVTVTFVGTPSATTAQTASLTVSDGTATNSITAYTKVGGP
jgi:hypothetical protein